MTRPSTTEAETTLLDDGTRQSTETGTPVEWTEESNYTFRLSAYEDRLLALYEEHPEFIAPATRRNEIVSFVKGGLKDLSISRTTFDWGVEVPGDPDHVMYVWVDALTNYLTGVGYPNVDSGGVQEVLAREPAHHRARTSHGSTPCTGRRSSCLPASNCRNESSSTGSCTTRARRCRSRSATWSDPIAMVDQYGLDAVRFFLLREISYGQDGSYSHEAIVTRMNADLSNELGNLAQRSLTMVAKKLRRPGTDPPASSPRDDLAMLASADALLAKCRSEFDVQALHLALEAIWGVLGETNRYFSKQEPWVLRKTDPARMATVLYVTIEVVRIVGLLVQPVMPDAASRILDLLGQSEENRQFTDIAVRIDANRKLPAPAPVFPRFVEE